MILKISMVGLFIVLILVLIISYYTQLEGFDTITGAVTAPITTDGIVPAAA